MKTERSFPKANKAISFESHLQCDDSPILSPAWTAHIWTAKRLCGGVMGMSSGNITSHLRLELKVGTLITVESVPPEICKEELPFAILACLQQPPKRANVAKRCGWCMQNPQSAAELSQAPSWQCYEDSNVQTK